MSLTKEQVFSRQRTLLTAFLLSAPGPVVLGFAVFFSDSSTQLADFIRRTVELAALFTSWWVFRQIHRSGDIGEEKQAKLERTAGLSVAGTMIFSGIVMLTMALSRFSVFESDGKVTYGLIIATLGLLTNGIFWWRYTVLTREQYSSVIAAQKSLYRAKASVDFCVVIALATIVIAPNQPATHYVDILGSIIVAAYLLFTGARSTRTHFVQDNGLGQRLEN